MKYFALSMLILLSPLTQAKQARSDFGYQIEIPENWSPLTGPEIKANPDLFDFDKVKDQLSEELLQQVIPLINSGQMDIYFLPDNTNQFADNINVMKQIGQVITDPSEVQKTCAGAAKELEMAFRHKVTVYKCETTKVSGQDAFYLKFDGALANTTSMQYHIKKSDNVFLMFTATAKNSSFNSIEAAFHQAIQSVKID